MTDKLVERALVRFVADCSDEEQQLPALQFICNRSPFIAEAITKALASSSVPERAGRGEELRLVDAVAEAIHEGVFGDALAPPNTAERAMYRHIAREVLEVVTAETPQSIPSEREEMLKWLDSRVVEHDRREPGSAFDSGRASAFYEAKQAIERGEHLTRQALEQGSAE